LCEKGAVAKLQGRDKPLCFGKADARAFGKARGLRLGDPARCQTLRRICGAQARHKSRACRSGDAARQ
jgi:hypothetical protein